MGTTPGLASRLLVTAAAATRTTDRLAGRVGATRFLPSLFALRYANMGGLDRAVFAGQLARCRSFADERWSGYWEAAADRHLVAAAGLLRSRGGPSVEALRSLLDVPDDDADPATVAALTAALDGAAPVLADHGPQPTHAEIARLAASYATDGDPEPGAVVAARGLDELVKAITYLQVAAFPGTTPLRMRAYRRSRRLFDAVASAMAAGLGITVERVVVPFEGTGDGVRGYAFFPASDRPVPTVLVTNGLEGTVQELLIPMLRYRAGGLGVVVMEMPGSYAYDEPMSPESAVIYDRVLAHLAADARVDATRIGMVGVSFGGYWAAAMAARNPLVRCAVACGAPTDRSFRPSPGLPEIIIDALDDVSGAHGLPDLLRRLRSLSLRHRYHEITVPLLVINGDDDTLLSTRDSIELAAGAPAGELLLYPDDDHCAMGHYREWLDHTHRWLTEQLSPGTSPA